MPNSINRILLQEWKKRTTPQQVQRALVTKAPSIKAVETGYNAKLQRAQIEINKMIRAEIEPLVRDTRRQDAVYDPIESMFDNLAKGILQVLLGASFQNIIWQGSEATSAVNYRKYDSDLYNMLGLNSAPTDMSQELLNNWIKTNTELITNVNRKQLASLQRIFRDNAYTNVRASELHASISKVFKGTRSNVKLIAVDQVQKLNGQLDQFKQTQAGIEGYYWRTSRDERVRSSHVVREGKYFRWDAPPPDGHPGQPIRCRCDAEPAVDRMVLSGKELRQVEAERKAKFAADRKQAMRRSRAYKQQQARRKAS